jgi:hypothetical protein
MELGYYITWFGILFCLSQSAMFSGMNLAAFSISRLRLEVQVATGDHNAEKVLALRRDSNFLLTTILWGNVGINVLLTLLSDSIMAGVMAFFFSTILITLVGEIAPQAYFSRHALKMAAFISPVLKLYQILLYPLAKPTALILDRWLGLEGIHFFRERDLREVIKIHMASKEAEVDHVEGAGALNFLALDDIEVMHEGEEVHPDSVITLPMDKDGAPIFPDYSRSADDPFLRQIERSEKKWIILVDQKKEPNMVLDSDGFLRHALFKTEICDPYAHCHRPIIVRDPHTSLGEVLNRFEVRPKRSGDDVIDQDIILIWGQNRRVITGADILGRLMRGIIGPTQNTVIVQPHFQAADPK